MHDTIIKIAVKLTYVSQSMANSNPISASGIPMTCKTIACTAIVTVPAKGGAASVASVADKLIKDNIHYTFSRQASAINRTNNFEFIQFYKHPGGKIHTIMG